MVYCGPHRGRHTGELVAEKLDEVIDSLELPPKDKLLRSMTTDNAANMKVACHSSYNIGEKNHLGCFDHKLNLIVNQGINKIKEIVDVVDKCKTLAASIHHSDLHCDRIKQACTNLNESLDGNDKISYIKISQPVDTRWNSTLFMLRSVFRMKKALLSVKYCHRRTTDKNLQKIIPAEEDYDLIEEVIPTLTRFEAASEFMGGEKYPTIASVITKVAGLDKHLGDICQTRTASSAYKAMCKDMKDNLDRRYPDLGTTIDVLAYTQLLHPGSKGTILYRTGKLQQTCSKFLAEHEAPIPVANLDDAVHEDFEDEEQAMLAEFSQGMTTEVRPDISPLAQELLAYRQGPMVKNVDVLAYWKAHEKQFPLLSQVHNN